MIHKFRGLQGLNEYEICNMINLNHNEIITIEEFLLFFLVSKSCIDN